MNTFGALLITIIVISAIFYGCFKCFVRNWLAALLLFFFFPGLLVWAFVELFTGPISLEQRYKLG